MKLEQSFEVAAPLERVWAALIDVERVAPCLPGASVSGRNEDGSYDGNFKVKIGPTSAAYSGKLMMEDIDESTHTATMQAQGTDRRGQGGAKATIVSRLTESGADATRVEVVTDYHITGRLARFGRGGMIEDISNRLLGEFAQCLQTSLAGAEAGGEAPAAETGSVAVAEAAAAGAAPTGAETIAAEAPTVASGPGGATTAAPTPGAPTAAGPTAGGPTAGGPTAGGPTAGGPTAGGPTAGGPPPPTPPVESEPIEGLSLMGSVLWNQAKRNPAPIVALVLGFLLALRVFRHRD